MTVVGAAFLVAYLAALVFRPPLILLVLGLATAFQNTAMFVLGSNSVTVFWGGVLVVVLRLAHLLLRPAPARLGTPVAGAVRIVLGALTLYAVAVTLIAPFVFQGMSVYVPRFGIDEQVLAQGTLQFGVSHIAQLVYLGLAVVLVAYVQFEREVPRGVLALGFGVGLAAALLREVMGDAWPTALLENMPNIWYSVYETRARGTFAEPSGLAAFLAAGFGYFGASLFVTRGAARWWHALGLLGTLAAYSVARAGTGLAGITGLLVVATITWLVRSGGRPVRLPPWIRPAGAVAAVLAVVASPVVYLYTVGLVQQKVGTTSATSRSAADAHAFGVFLESYGLGVGLGSNRPSSLAMLVLSNLGIVGSVLLILLVVLAATSAYRVTAARPYTWTLVAALAAGISSKPDLSEPMLWLTIALCIRAASDAELARGVLARGTARRRAGAPLRPDGRWLRGLSRPTPAAAPATDRSA